MKIIIALVHLTVLFPITVYSTEIWAGFDMALGYKTSRILNNVVLSFLKEPKASSLLGELDLVYGIVSPSDKIEYVPSDHTQPGLEQSYITLIERVMKTPILDHGAQFKAELEELSKKLLSKTFSNVPLQYKESEDGVDSEFGTKTHLTEMEQAHVVNLLVSELCKIIELANSYWDDELDEMITLFLSNLGYKGRHISKIHKNNSYYSSIKLNKRQRMDFQKYFAHGLEKSQNFINELEQKIKDFPGSSDRFGVASAGFYTNFLKYFPHEYYSLMDWFRLYGYLEKLKADLIKEVGLNRSKGYVDAESAIRFITGDIISGDFVKIIKNHRIETKIYKVLRVKRGVSVDPFNKNASNVVLLHDFETGKRLQVESDLLIRTMDIECFHRDIKMEFIKELVIINRAYLTKTSYAKSNVKGKCGDILLSVVTSMLKDRSKLKNIDLERVISAIEILNYALRFNEFPVPINNDQMVAGNANVQGLTTQNLMKCGSPLLILIVNKYYSLTGKFPEYQDCSIKTFNDDVSKCEPVAIEFNKFKGWKKAFDVLFSSANPDLSFNENSIAFWTSSIRSSRIDDLLIPPGYANCDEKCLKKLLFNKGVENNVVYDILGQISWHLSPDMILLDKLVAKFYSLIEIQVASIKTYGSPNVSSEISNLLRYTVCDDECYTYGPDLVILSYFRWLENESNHFQKMPLINYYYLAFSIHSRFIEFLNTYKNLRPGRLSKRIAKSIINKYYRLHSLYVQGEYVPPQNYPFATYVLQIVFFLSDYLESYKSKVVGLFPKNFSELVNAAEPSTFSNVNRFKKVLSILRRFAIKFIFRFMSNKNTSGMGGVLDRVKHKVMKLGGGNRLMLSVINDNANANLKYGPLAVATVLSWALNGQDISPKLEHDQWKPYVTNLYSSNIPQYRKYFFYMILNNGKSPDQVAWDIISNKCKIGKPKAVKRNLLNVLSSSSNLLLVIDMANEIAKECNNPNYDIKNSRLFVESNCHSFKLNAIKQFRANMNIVHRIKVNLKVPIKKHVTKAMVEKCDWFYDTKYYKLVQNIMGSDKEYSINLNLIKTIKLYFGYKDFEYEYVPLDTFITGVYDYYSPLFDNLGICNNSNEIESAKCQYETFIRGSKKQILLQQVYDGQVYIFKVPIQTRYKFGRVFITEDTLNKLIIAGVEIPECNGKCNVGDFRKVVVKKWFTDRFGIPIIKPHHISEIDTRPLNVVYFNSIIFQSYQVKDVVSSELITIDDVNQHDVLVCADDDFYHNNIDIESIKNGENVDGLMNYPAFGYKFLKRHNVNNMKNNCWYFLVNILPILPGNYTQGIIDPVEAGAKNFAKLVANVN